jgi:hypothetical protein
MQTARIGDWGQRKGHTSKKASARMKYRVRPRRFSKFLAALQESKQGWRPVVRPYRHRNIQSIVDREFEKQRQLFQSIPISELKPYHGQFVASYNGQIVDHDDDLAALTYRFFSQYGEEAAVYMTRIGEPIRVVLSTPLAR